MISSHFRRAGCDRDQYSLLGKLSNGYYCNGSSHDHFHKSWTTRLYLRTDDNVAGNGRG